MIRLKLISTLIVSIGIAGCATTKSDWEQAQNHNTVESYRDFMSKHPKSEFDSDARSRIESFTWKDAEQINTIGSYRDFVSKYPNSKFTPDAKSRIESFVWKDTEQINAIGSYRDFASKYPNSKFTPDAKSRIEKLLKEAGLFIEGTYRGMAKDKSEMDITLVGYGESIKVSRLGYKFVGSMRVADVLMETKAPFGTMENRELNFQFPVFVSFMLPRLNSISANVGIAIYKAQLKNDNGILICELERIEQLSPEYKTLTMKQISMEGKMPDGTGMLQKYRFVLEPEK